MRKEIVLAAVLISILSFCVVDGQITHGKLSHAEKVPIASATETTSPSPGTGQTIGNLSNLATTPGTTTQEPAQNNPVASISQTNDFDRYQLSYWSDLPEINCYMGEGKWAGSIMFYTNNTQNKYVDHIFEWPYTDFNGNTEVLKLIVLYYPISQFENVMNILRYSNGTLTLQIVDARGGLVSAVKRLGP